MHLSARGSVNTRRRHSRPETNRLVRPPGRVKTRSGNSRERREKGDAFALQRARHSGNVINRIRNTSAAPIRWLAEGRRPREVRSLSRQLDVPRRRILHKRHSRVRYDFLTWAPKQNSARSHRVSRSGYLHNRVLLGKNTTRCVSIWKLDRIRKLISGSDQLGQRRRRGAVQSDDARAQLIPCHAKNTQRRRNRTQVQQAGEHIPAEDKLAERTRMRNRSQVDPSRQKIIRHIQRND